jgi:4-amino-4-deoxy-L-arabinose transferase-like glycosyltransferase
LLWLGVIMLLGLAVRGWYIHVHTQHPSVFSDVFYYHGGANLLAEGHGFVHPYDFVTQHRSVPGADHPPGYIVALAVASVFGFKSFFAHQIWSALIGTATIGVVGLVGRHIAGPRAALIAAFIAAVYPNFWFSDALIMSETLVLLMAALTLLTAYRFWERPGAGRAIVLGVTCGLTALTRSEAVLLLPLLVLPLVAFLRQLSVRRRIALLAIAVSATMATVAPWVTYNLARFEHPVLLSIPDATLLAGNCRDTYYGTFIGYWSVPCVLRLNLNSGDRSTAGVVYRREARRFIGRNLGRLPFVVFAREGRTWGFYHPDEQLQLDRLATKELELSRLGLGMYYVLAAGTISGALILRRRRVPVFPLIAILLTPALSVAVTIGETRYRALAEVALVLGAAVTIDAVISRLRPRRRAAPEGASVGPSLGDGGTPGGAPTDARLPAQVGPPGG